MLLRNTKTNLPSRRSARVAARLAVLDSAGAAVSARELRLKARNARMETTKVNAKQSKSGNVKARVGINPRFTKRVSQLTSRLARVTAIRHPMPDAKSGHRALGEDIGNFPDRTLIAVNADALVALQSAASVGLEGVHTNREGHPAGEGSDGHIRNPTKYPIGTLAEGAMDTKESTGLSYSSNPTACAPPSAAYSAQLVNVHNALQARPAAHAPTSNPRNNCEATLPNVNESPTTTSNEIDRPPMVAAFRPPGRALGKVAVSSPAPVPQTKTPQFSYTPIPLRGGNPTSFRPPLVSNDNLHVHPSFLEQRMRYSHISGRFDHPPAVNRAEAFVRARASLFAQFLLREEEDASDDWEMNDAKEELDAQKLYDYKFNNEYHDLAMREDKHEVESQGKTEHKCMIKTEC
jgi:hypothetical protein